MTETFPSKNIVKSVDRACRILDALCSANGPVSLGSLADKVGMHKTTVYRLLRTMMRHGLVQQREHRAKYDAGMGLVGLAHKVMDRLELRTQGLPWLKELSERTNETVHLAILDQGQVVYVEKQESKQTLRIYSAVGKRAPAHCTGLGKTLLAYLPQEEVDRIIEKKGLRRYTSRSITSPEALKQELAIVRARGYAVDDAEHEEGVRCIACPVWDHRGRVIGAISVTAPASRLNLEGAQETCALVRRYAYRISQEMGYVSEREHDTNGLGGSS